MSDFFENDEYLDVKMLVFWLETSDAIDELE